MFNISPELEKNLKTMREFVDAELVPLEPEFLAKGFLAMEPVLQEKRQIVRDLGLWLPQVAKEYGGMGLDAF